MKNEVKDESDGWMFWRCFLMFFFSQYCLMLSLDVFLMFPFLSFFTSSRNPLDVGASQARESPQESRESRIKDQKKDMQETAQEKEE
jgi:hypothetical protein